MSRLHKSVGALLAMTILIGMLPAPVVAGESLSLDTTHKYLAFSTIGLAGATALTSGDPDIHEPLAYATAAFALSTMLTGYITHSDRFDTTDGFFTQDNSHIILGTIGALMLTTGVLLAADSYDGDKDGSVEASHAGLAGAGGMLMAIAIVDIKW
jgi:hypothetical protein